MTDYSQGDIIKIAGFRTPFLIISKNAYIRNTKTFHVCPFLPDYAGGPLHIPAQGIKGTKGTAVCEQIKLIDPLSRRCHRIDRLPYEEIMNISDAIQGMFEYD